MKNRKVAVTLTSFSECDATPLFLLNQRGFEVVCNTLARELDKNETSQFCHGCVGIVAGTEVYDRDVLNRLPGLKVISRCGVGMDNIDLDVARKLGITIFNTPDAPTLAVAELTVGLILALLRRISLIDRQMHAGLWNKRMGRQLSGKEVGIVGFGRIGRKVAQLLKMLGADVSYFDPFVKGDEISAFTKVELKELLEKSDLITLHLSYSKENRHLIGKQEFSLMKQGACLVNCSRGGVVDEQALYSALKENKLAGAAIDVFEKEPYHGPLKELDNVILTPHIGSFAEEARVKMEIQAVENLIKGLDNG